MGMGGSTELDSFVLFKERAASAVDHRGNPLKDSGSFLEHD